MAENGDMAERIQKFCQSLKYQDSRPLEPHEHFRLDTLRAELVNRSKQGKWQLPLMILFVVVLVLALRLFGAIIGSLVMGIWYPKFRTAKEFTRMMEEGNLEPVVDRFVAVEGSSIEGLFVNDKPRARKKNPFVTKEIEVLADRFVWSVNGNPVPTSLADVRIVAAPPPEVELNLDRVRTANAPEPISRTLTAIESQELIFHHRSIKAQSVLLKWLKFGGFIFALLLIIGISVSANDPSSEWLTVFGIIGGMVFLVCALGGWSIDRGILSDYLRLRKDVAERRVDLVEHPNPQCRGRLVEVLSHSGALWTVDGVPAVWRTQV